MKPATGKSKAQKRRSTRSSAPFNLNDKTKRAPAASVEYESSTVPVEYGVSTASVGPGATRKRRLTQQLVRKRQTKRRSYATTSTCTEENSSQISKPIHSEEKSTTTSDFGLSNQRKSNKTTAEAKSKEIDGSALTPQRPTPYWKAIEEDGREPSPRMTRSSTKKGRREIPQDGGLDSDNETKGRVLNFSPPNQVANRERERVEIERKEASRIKRVQKARKSGQLLEYSPNGNLKNPGVLLQLSAVSEESQPQPESRDLATELKKADDEETPQKSKTENETKLASLKLKGCKSNRNETGPSLVVKEHDLKAKAEVKALRRLLTENEEKLREAEKENVLFQQELQRIGVTMKERLEASSAMESVLQEKEADLDAALADKERMSISHSQLRHELQNVNNELTQKAAQVSTLEARIDEINAKSTIKEESSRLRLKECEESLAAAQEEKKILNEELETVRQEFQNSKIELEARAMDALKEEKESEVRAIETKLKVREKYLAESLESLNVATQKAERMETDLLHTQEDLNKKTSHIASLKEETTLLKSRNDQLASRLETLERRVSELDGIRMDQNKEIRSIKSELEVEKTKHNAIIASATAANNRAEEEKLRRVTAENDLASKVLAMQNATSEHQTQLDKRMIDLEETKEKLREVLVERDSAKNLLLSFGKREAELLKKVSAIDQVRRTLHNRVIQLSGNIRVFVRVRPILEGESKALSAALTSSQGVKRMCEQNSPFEFPGSSNRTSPSPNEGSSSVGDWWKKVIEIKEPLTDRGGLNPRRRKWKFGFDNVFSPENDQLDVWKAVKPLVQSTIDGFNVCVFAYGQTGSGKTHTMVGSSPSNEQGLTFRSVKKLFESKRDIESSSNGEVLVEISVELLEIYNEKIRDLLARNSNSDSGTTERSLRVNGSDTVGNVQVYAESEDDVVQILAMAQRRRCVKATKLNAESSRSHMLFTMHFAVRRADEESLLRCGKINICDLAGSERLDKSGSNGITLKETQHINSSLMSLSNVIEKLQSGGSHIPYRDSKLTTLLRSSLEGDSKTLAIVCCNPLPVHFNESLCSLRFAAKCNRVELKGAGNYSC